MASANTGIVNTLLKIHYKLLLFLFLPLSLSVFLFHSVYLYYLHVLYNVRSYCFLFVCLWLKAVGRNQDMVSFNSIRNQDWLEGGLCLCIICLDIWWTKKLVHRPIGSPKETNALELANIKKFIYVFACLFIIQMYMALNL